MNSPEELKEYARKIIAAGHIARCRSEYPNGDASNTELETLSEIEMAEENDQLNWDDVTSVTPIARSQYEYRVGEKIVIMDKGHREQGVENGEIDKVLANHEYDVLYSMNQTTGKYSYQGTFSAWELCPALETN